MATKSKSSAAATRARRAKLAEDPVEYLRAKAAKLDIPGRSSMNKQALVKAIDLAQSGKAPKRKPTQKARQKAAAAKKREASVGYGRGPFRLVIAKDDAIYGNLGPYASARAALSDAKTLLRRMAPVKGYALSNTEAQSFVGQSYAGGKIVDGYVVQSKGGTDLNAAAFAVKVGKGSKAAYAADKIPPKLRNRGRRNPRVSFQTKDGPVSFMAKKKRNAGARSNGNKSVAKLRISANRWRDSYGNTYHRAYISVNGRHVGVTPITYGYGSQYLDTAKKWLAENGYRKPSGRMSSYDAGYSDVKRKRDL